MADDELSEVALATPANCALLLAALGVAAAVAAVAIPNMIPARKCCGGNESAAIGSLKTIGTSQSLFRESDKESDGNLDYGTLKELAQAGSIGLIDGVLGSGTKHGYLFEATYSRTTSEFLWYTTARPSIPTTTGDRYLCANHEGVTFYTVSQAFSLNSDDCTIPAGVRPVGK